MRLLQLIEAMCERLGLDVQKNATIEVKSGERLTALCLISNLGARKGTLIFTDRETTETFGSKIVDLGYGYTTLTNSMTDRGSFDENFETYVEMFKDWGWAGDEALRPVWLSIGPSEQDT